MEIKKLDQNLSVSGQIGLDDLEALHQAGVQTVICNRPDNEDEGQPLADTIAARAIELGMAFHFMPVVSGQVTSANGESFGELLASNSAPVHAYCRSGMRCTTLWALAQLQSGNMDTPAVVHKAAEAGYDISRMFG